MRQRIPRNSSRRFASQPDLSPSARLQLAAEADRSASTPATKGLLLDAIAQDSGLTAGNVLHVTLTGNTPISANGGILLGIDDNVLAAVLDATTLGRANRSSHFALADAVSTRVHASSA